MTRRLSVLCALCVLCGANLWGAREIPNTATAIRESADAPPLHYADLLRVVASATPQGITVEQMRQRIRILDACDRAKDQPTIILEDADYTAALELVKAHRWGGVDRDLIAFTDAVENAKEIKVEASK